jgi:hypothetical protein
VSGYAQNGLVRVTVTRIEQDGTMQRRMVDTARCSDGPRWESLAGRALLQPPPYHPVPGAPMYHVSLDDGTITMVAEDDLCGPLLDLVTAVLARGDEVLGGSPDQAQQQRSQPRPGRHRFLGTAPPPQPR